ncbi:MAG: protease/lipase ABC transporter permease/ATP-binding protein, partial [Proteobacteria bacterium]|nr:protease/lipase ABC transporter permease/ATP-binding protein [Pseudomonadota bacterium]
MQDIIKSGFKFLISAAFFRGCINLIYLSIPIYMLIIYDRVLFSASLATLYTLGVGVLICLLTMGVIDYAQKQIMGKAASRLALKMRPFVLNSLPGFPRGLEDLETLRTAVAGGHLIRFLDLPWMVIYLILLYLIHPIMGGMSAAGVIIAAIALGLIKILAKKRYIAAELAFKANRDRLQKAMAHRDLVSAMGLYPGVIKKYIHIDDRVMELRVKAEQFQGITDAALTVLYSLVPTLVFATGVVVFFSEKITVGAVFACVIILVRLFGPLEKSLKEMRISIEARAAYDRIKTFVN